MPIDSSCPNHRRACKCREEAVTKLDWYYRRYIALATGPKDKSYLLDETLNLETEIEQTRKHLGLKTNE